MFQTKTAKSTVGLTLSVDSSQAMTAADFIASRGKFTSEFLSIWTYVFVVLMFGLF